jgi:L-rhamnose mutarotase
MQVVTSESAMPRVAFHLEIKDGKPKEYREEHKNVPDELEKAYLESGAGLETYSVFEKDGHVFGYMEVEDPDVIDEVMENSEAQERWNEVMDPILEDADDIWMDEVYRMV